MFARQVAFVYAFLALVVLAAATPAPENAKRWAPPPTTTTATVTKTISVTATATPTGSTCSTGPVQCCNSLQSATGPVGSLLLGLLGIVVEGVDVLLGLNCSPITVIGVGDGGSCSSNVVCCQNNAVGGLISIGCLPITL